ncbi:RnfABCDGE type electron transport complex subunit G [Alloiococcus sp. CFN-8]|uniref:RnfABCDGE type electron transport complex subunit G n=1 Tax=Alloiococcus sp. CFN-8 TaxID=3416081 RepID=UPI003CF789AF
MNIKKILKDTLMITIITLVAGIALGFTYKLTKKPIEEQSLISKQKAYQAVFSEASEFSQDSAVNMEESGELLLENGITSVTIDEVAKAIDNSGDTLGYVISVTDSGGYSGDISFSLGIAMDGTIKGVSLLSISETAGLGMKAKTTNWLDQFANKQVEAFNVIKGSSSSESDIEAISGATITSNSITNGVNAGLCFFRSIQEGGNQ